MEFNIKGKKGEEGFQTIKGITEEVEKLKMNAGNAISLTTGSSKLDDDKKGTAAPTASK